ncbi:peptide chain release factor-like protein [Candidatus Pacearchaeota archaeon]|nr:peptide chain release factor-like protein [Candidatus Pacearchaeota archaeon]
MSKPLLTLTKKDFVIWYFSGRGAGGQHRNRHMNCVKITHPESKVSGCGTEQRSREQNKRMAFKRLAADPKFKAWLSLQGLYKEAVDQAVEEAMNPKNLKVEMMKEGKWEETD